MKITPMITQSKTILFCITSSQKIMFKYANEALTFKYALICIRMDKARLAMVVSFYSLVNVRFDIKVIPRVIPAHPPFS